MLRIAVGGENGAIITWDMDEPSALPDTAGGFIRAANKTG
jgi:hypothetical protein